MVVACACVLSLLAALERSALLGVAAAPSPSPVRTDAIIRVPLQERHGSGVRGTVTLSPQGPKTIVHVYVFSLPPFHPDLSLRSGSDCMDARSAATRMIPLSPVSTGQVSQTIVSIPLSSFSTSHFVVDLRDATSRAQFAQACARFSR